jgi:hypothetical protein
MGDVDRRFTEKFAGALGVARSLACIWCDSASKPRSAARDLATANRRRFHGACRRGLCH